MDALSRILGLLAVVTWLAVGALGMETLERPEHLPWALLLWSAFGVLLVWSLVRPLPMAPYLGLQSLLITGLMGLGRAWNPFPVLFFLLSTQAALMYPLRRTLVWTLGFGALSFAVLTAKAGWATGLLGTAVFASGYAFFAVFAHALRQAQEAQAQTQRLLDRLREANERLRAYARQSAALAVAEERNRMARELHDTLGHHLTVAAVQLEAAQALVHQDPERAARLMATVQEQIRQSLAELRLTVTALRQPVEDLAQAVQDLARRFAEATGLTLHVHMEGDLHHLPPAHRLLLYRAVQEGLTNIQRHARARTAWLHLARQGTAVRLILEDDGVGPRPPATPRQGWGLKGMAEAAARLGGTARLEPREPTGARLELVLPLDEDERPTPGGVP